jgi:CubicO group peptidase (beta-lactamase class C family)
MKNEMDMSPRHIRKHNLPELEQRLANLAEKYDARPDTVALQFSLSLPASNWRWEWASPGAPRQHFIASTTKLYVTAMIMQLRSEGSLDLDAPAARYLEASIMAGIHRLRGVDSGNTITVRQLLSHTSGIADYFEQRRLDGSSQFRDCLCHDIAWSFDDILSITRQLKPKFTPATPGKAFYSDTNYQLLGAIIEKIDGVTYEDALHKRIIEPLGLHQTYPFSKATLHRYGEVAPMLYGKKPLVIPQAMASVRADGGIVSTSKDGITFLDAFMNGKLFPTHYLDEMQHFWNPIFPPLEYGVGIMRLELPRYYTLFMQMPPMIGHSGASGAVLFYVPELDLYVSGTVNQIKNRSLSYNLMIRLVMTVMNAISKG